MMIYLSEEKGAGKVTLMHCDIAVRSSPGKKINCLSTNQIVYVEYFEYPIQ
jgi:hypothetical protein